MEWMPASFKAFVARFRAPLEMYLAMALWLPLGGSAWADALQEAGPGGNVSVRRSVTAITLPSTSVDDPTSWLIQPDVPRIPNIAGLEPNLPPHIERRLSSAFDLAQRGATYSANEEFRAVLGLCALELDSREGGTRRREALQAAWLAVDEADEFDTDRIELRNAADFRVVAAGHKTPVLRQAGSAGVAIDSIQAVRAYYAYAEQRFIESCHGLPGASLGFYGVARTFVVPGARTTHAAGKAAMLQRVALAVAPQNVLAGNELGVLLAEHGQLDDAEKLFRRCLATSPSPETWRNLAVVYARQGDRAASQLAYETGDALAAKENESAAANSAQNAIARGPDDGDSATTKEKQGILAKFPLFRLQNPFRR